MVLPSEATVAPTRTTPYSRVDIFTGDLNTNAFRGFMGRRWRNGLMFQAGGQQVATQSGRVTAFEGNTGRTLRSDGSVQLFLARLGWARGKWSVDALGQGGARDRDRHMSRDSSLFTDLPRYKGSHREGYVRVGYGDTLRGFWSQAMVQSRRVKIEPDTFEVVVDAEGFSSPRPDTIAARTQQVVALGYRADRWAVSLTDRIRPQNGVMLHSAAARGSASWRAFSVGGWVERADPDSTDRIELVAQFRPNSWFVANVAHATRTPGDSSLQIATSSQRAEAAVRYRNIWLSGGVLREEAVRYGTMELLQLPGVQLEALASQGIMVGARGKLYKDLQFDVHTIRWDTEQFQRPATSVRAEVALISDWLRRFPKGEFGFNARMSYEMRSGVPFYYGVRGEEQTPDIRITEKAQVATAHLEIRIQKGTLFYQYRNLSGGQYEQIRGITMPPAVQMYGMRWEFWN